MFPVLFSVGQFEFKTFVVFVVLALFSASFIFWRKSKEEHYPSTEIFDGFVLATVVGLVVARAVFILFNTHIFGFAVLKWFDFSNYPGTNLLAGLAGAGLYIYSYATKNKWDEFEILDFWVTSTSFGLALHYLGTFFGGTGFGYATTLPWGVVFPQLIDPHHPVQLYFSLFYFGLYTYLSKVEYSYRTFTWYRYGKKTAQTGFLTSCFLLFVGIFSVIMTFVKPATLEFMGVNIDALLSILVALYGAALLWIRSGRVLPLIPKKKTRLTRTTLEQLREQ